MQRLVLLGILSTCLVVGGPVDTMAVVSDEEFEAMKKRLGTV